MQEAQVAEGKVNDNFLSLYSNLAVTLKAICMLTRLVLCTKPEVVLPINKLLYLMFKNLYSSFLLFLDSFFCFQRINVGRILQLQD